LASRRADDRGVALGLVVAETFGADGQYDPSGTDLDEPAEGT
jgi:hypothetical protein